MKAQPERLFLFRLARELGMPVGRMLTEMDSREIAEWMAFFWIENEETKKRQQQQKTGSGDIGSKIMACSPTIRSGGRGSPRERRS